MKRNKKTKSNCILLVNNQHSLWLLSIQKHTNHILTMPNFDIDTLIMIGAATGHICPMWVKTP